MCVNVFLRIVVVKKNSRAHTHTLRWKIRWKILHPVVCFVVTHSISTVVVFSVAQQNNQWCALPSKMWPKIFHPNDMKIYFSCIYIYIFLHVSVFSLFLSVFLSLVVHHWMFISGIKCVIYLMLSVASQFISIFEFVMHVYVRLLYVYICEYI